MTAPVLGPAGTRRGGAARMDSLRRPLDLCALALTGAAAWRSTATQTHQDLVQPLPLTCRIAVVPTVPACGSTTVALQITGALTRARRAPALLLSASPGTNTAADRLSFSRRWPLEEPVPTAVPPAQLGPALRGAAGCGPDGLTSCLRLDPGAAHLPPSWHQVRRELGHFFDACLTETGLLPPEELAEIAPLHHAVVVVSPARRREVERTRERLQGLKAALADRAAKARADGAAPTAAAPSAGIAGGPLPVVLHAIVATTPGHPLIPRPEADETLIPYDPALRRPGPSPLRRRTAVAVAALAARAVDAAAQTVRITGEVAAGGEA
ncbi:hypothetical protein [Actinomyces qiguomingii]|uniref:hypothetical protein n=1 Tax=Actinomyces qiguomingii TaxID=2057800 RepID=UPI000CA06964|nr:hypothetical protein [Actinomyces qiguomingii]